MRLWFLGKKGLRQDGFDILLLSHSFTLDIASPLSFRLGQNSLQTDLFSVLYIKMHPRCKRSSLILQETLSVVITMVSGYPTVGPHFLYVLSLTSPHPGP